MPKEEPEEEQPDYTLDEAVLDYIREEKHKRGTGGQVRGRIRFVLSCINPICQVWTAPALLLLLRAREQARLRRQEWEDWAVERHGSLQAAYSLTPGTAGGQF